MNISLGGSTLLTQESPNRPTTMVPIIIMVPLMVTIIIVAVCMRCRRKNEQQQMKLPPILIKTTTAVRKPTKKQKLHEQLNNLDREESPRKVAKRFRVTVLPGLGL